MCTEMLWKCLQYVSVGSKVRPRNFGWVTMGSVLLCIFRSRLFVYSAGSGVNRVRVVLSSPVSLLLLRAKDAPQQHSHLINCTHIVSQDLWIDPARVTALLASMREHWTH